MPLTAILSDIHSNLAALTAVIADLREHKADRIVCLGDVIGYGPQPLQCVDIARKEFDFTILGNHEEAVLYGAVGFNPKAKAAVDWTRDQFHLESEAEEDRDGRWQFLGDMPISVEEEDDNVQFVHGSPRQPTIEYILREDIYNGAYDKFEEIFASFEKCLFVGHSHTPCVISEDLEYFTVKDLDYQFAYEDATKKYIVNVGSVGQPRDNDTRACYVEIDQNNIYFRRVEYDYKATANRIFQIERLSDKLGHRLTKGV